MKIPRVQPSFFAGITTLALMTLAFGGGVALVVLTHPKKEVIEPQPIIFPMPITLQAEQLRARSAIVYDPTSGRILFAKNKDEQLPLASLTKLMTAEVVLQQKTPTTSVRIVQSDLNHGGNWGLKAGDVLSLSNLLKLGLIASSNDAMVAAAGSLGEHYLDVMNQTARDLGLNQTYFLNPTGLDESATTAGAYSTVYDVARLAALFYKKHPHYFELTKQPSVSYSSDAGTLSFAATAAPLFTIPGLVGAKTGYTDLAGGNLVAIFDIEIGHPLVAVVLGSTQKERFADIETLVHAARAQTTP